jgi:hypothetical protein
VEQKYQSLGIDTSATAPIGFATKGAWLNGVTIPVKQMTDKECSTCLKDLENFNPANVGLLDYERRTYGMHGEKPIVGQHALCSPYCLWWGWVSEKRKTKSAEYAHVASRQKLADEKVQAELYTREAEERRVIATKASTAKVKEKVKKHEEAKKHPATK